MHTPHVTGFQLRGAEGDETRLLIHPERGYAIAVPGHPQFTSPAFESPRYDAVLTLAMGTIELGVRMDEIPTTVPAESLIATLAMAYANTRAADATGARSQVLDGKLLAEGADAGVRVSYGLLGDDAAAMEFLAIMAKTSGPLVHALHLTVRYRRGETSPFEWASLRAALLNHQSWAQTEPSTQIWPVSAFAAPSFKLQLSDAANHEARAKAEEVGALDADEVDQLADILIAAATTDDPPTIEMPSFVLQTFTRSVAACVSSRAAEVLLRDLPEVQTMHDFRAWCWECYWAVGNRAQLRRVN